MNTTRAGHDFGNWTSLRSDQCEETTRDMENDAYSNYLLQSTLARPGSLGPAYTDVGIFPGVSDMRFAVDAPPRPGDTSKASKLAFARPFVTAPYMGAGQTSIVNPDADSALTRGEISNTKKMYNPAPARSNTYRPMPMIPGIASQIQNPVHIIPQLWTRGGVDTRGNTRSINGAHEQCFQG